MGAWRISKYSVAAAAAALLGAASAPQYAPPINDSQTRHGIQQLGGGSGSVMKFGQTSNKRAQYQLEALLAPPTKQRRSRRRGAKNLRKFLYFLNACVWLHCSGCSCSGRAASRRRRRQTTATKTTMMMMKAPPRRHSNGARASASFSLRCTGPVRRRRRHNR